MDTLEEFWTSQLAAANKALGSKGRIPTGRLATVLTRAKEVHPLDADFEKAVDMLANKLLALKGGFRKVKLALEQAQNELEHSDYDLNPKDPADKAKIAAAHRILMDFFAGAESLIKGRFDTFSDLDKHIEPLDRYRSIKI